MRRGTSFGLLLFSILASACTSQPRVATTVDTNFEGLTVVRSERFEQAQLRPGIDFTTYRSVFVADAEVEFRTPNRSQSEFPLSTEQRERLADVLDTAFQNEFAGNGSMPVAAGPGPDVVELGVRVIDVVARVPARTASVIGATSIALEATGTVTLVLEVRDSESGEILARGVETRAVRGAAALRGNDMITRWEDVDGLAARWATAARAGLEELLTYDGS